MKRINFDRNKQRLLRQKRNLNKLKKIDNNKPRLLITKSNGHIYAQLIDMDKSRTLAASSSLSLKLANGNVANATKVGTDIAKKAIKLGIKEISFDRGGSKYHGKILALANAARKEGLSF